MYWRTSSWRRDDELFDVRLRLTGEFGFENFVVFHDVVQLVREIVVTALSWPGLTRRADGDGWNGRTLNIIDSGRHWRGSRYMA
jgi:hypothetical protein